MKEYLMSIVRSLYLIRYKRVVRARIDYKCRLNPFGQLQFNAWNLIRRRTKLSFSREKKKTKIERRKSIIIAINCRIDRLDAWFIAEFVFAYTISPYRDKDRNRSRYNPRLRQKCVTNNFEKWLRQYIVQ